MRELKKLEVKYFVELTVTRVLDKNYLRQGLKLFQENYPNFSAVGPSVEVVSQNKNLFPCCLLSYT